MGKKRTSSKNMTLPKRWGWRRGAIYYAVPKGLEDQWDGKQLFKLGNTESEAYQTWAERIEFVGNVRTINDLLERYASDVVPNKAIKTQTENNAYMKHLRAVFGDMKLHDLEPQHIYQYVDQRRKKVIDKNGRTRGGLSIARKEIHMLSDAYTYAVRWGYMKSHPFKGEIKLDTEKPRDRYIENWEMIEFFKIEPTGNRRDSSRTIHAYAKVKLLTGLRQQDLLSMKVSQLREDGIHVTPLKTVNSTGKTIIIEWSAALREAVEYARSIRPVDISAYLFCKLDGTTYYKTGTKDPASGWKTNFARYMDKVIDKTELEVRFTDHDIRAKCSSDIDEIEDAMKLLAHSSSKTTQRSYRRKPQKVKPAR